MPPAVPLIAAAAAYGTSAAIGAGFLGALAGAVVATAINTLGSRVLAKKPKALNFTAEARGTTTMVRSSVESHKLVYGTVKTSGPIIYANTTNSGPNSAGQTVTGDNKFLHLVIPLAGHEVEDIVTIYLNDTPVTLDGGGYVTSAPYAYNSQNSTQVSVNISTGQKAGGSSVLFVTSTAHGFSAGDTVSVNGVLDNSYNGTYRISEVTGPQGFKVEGVSAVSVSSSGGVATRKAQSGSTGAYVRVKKHLGSASQTADSDLIAECGWTAAHRLQGIAYIYVRLEWLPEVFTTGIPNISAVVKGKKVYDPRNGLTAWSDNWALCVRDYLASDYGFNAQSGEINDAYFIAAANVSDESVGLKAGGTEARYTADGVLDTATAPLDNLSGLLTAGAGAVTYVQGQFRLHAAAYDSPSGDIGLDMLAGDVQMDARVGRKDLFNAVRGTYVDPNKLWQPTDFPPVTNATYQAQDNGAQIYKDLELPFTTGPETAQRIGKLVLEKGRQGIRVTIPVNHTALKYAVYDVVTLTNAYLGWDAKPFRILRWNLNVPGPITLSLQEESSASYDWNAGEATTIDTAPDTNLPNPFLVAAPTGVAADSGTAQLSLAGDGTVISRILASWNPSTDIFVLQGGSTQVQYKRADLTSYQDAPPPVGNATQTFVTGVDDGEPYDVRVRFRNALGFPSPWTEITHKVIGKSLPPADVTSFSSEGRNASWTSVADIDLAGYRVKYQPGTSRSWGDAILFHQGLLTSSPYTLPMQPSGTVTIMIKAVDTSGNESESPAYIVANLGDPLVANIVETFDLKAAGWLGTLTGGTVDGSNHLVADGTSLMWGADDSAAMWSADPTDLMWHASTFVRMTYEETVAVSAALAGSQMTIDATITGDPWTVEYRENGAALMWSDYDQEPMWGVNTAALMWDEVDYRPWPGSITVANTSYDFRVTTAAGTTQGAVDDFMITVDAPDIDETLNDVVIGSGGTRLPITRTYDTIKNLQLTVQADGGTAISARYDDKDPALGPLVRCLDAAGSSVAGTVDARIQGF